MSYADYLASPQWQARREWAIAAAGSRCQLCNAAGALETHHRTYDRLGHELPGDLVALCSACHEAYHRWSAPAPRATEADRHYRRRLAIEASVEAAFAGPRDKMRAEECQPPGPSPSPAEPTVPAVVPLAAFGRADVPDTRPAPALGGGGLDTNGGGEDV